MGFFQYLKSKEFFLTIISILAISVLLLFGLGRWLDYYTHHEEKIKVPHLEKLSLAETQQTLKQNDLSFVVIDSASFNPDFPPQSVIEQDPEPGDYVKKGRKIYLTLNPMNYRKIAVPEFKRKGEKEVITRLKSAGFVIGEKHYKPFSRREYALDKESTLVDGLEIKGKPVKAGEQFLKFTRVDLIILKNKEFFEKDSVSGPEILPAGE